MFVVFVFMLNNNYFHNYREQVNGNTVSSPYQVRDEVVYNAYNSED